MWVFGVGGWVREQLGSLNTLGQIPSQDFSFCIVSGELKSNELSLNQGPFLIQGPFLGDLLLDISQKSQTRWYLRWGILPSVGLLHGAKWRLCPCAVLSGSVAPSPFFRLFCWWAVGCPKNGPSPKNGFPGFLQGH